MTALMLWACEEETQYVRQDQLAIKRFMIKAQTDPHLLPDGSIVTLVADNSNDTSAMTPMSQSYRLVKLSTDGTITQSPTINYRFGNGNRMDARGEVLSFDDDNDLFDIDITSSGEVFFQYTTKDNKFAVSKFETGIYIDTTLSSFVDGKFLGGTPLDDGTYAVIHGTDPVMSILDANGEWVQHFSLPYLHCDNNETYKVVGICGNIMIIRTNIDLDHEFYVYSPAGELLNYGSLDLLFDRLINITDPETNKATHCYAITNGIEETTDDGSTIESCQLTRLDTKGSITYETICSQYEDICNIIEQDGKIILSGYYVPQSYESLNINEYMMAAASIKGKITILDAETGENPESHLISLEGGVMPYAAVPDNHGGYDIFLSRIFSYDVGQMSANVHYTESIFIYHTDDLNKLQIE